MPSFDVHIKGGTIVDGTRVPRYKGDLWIKDGKIAQVGGRPDRVSERIIDATGLIVAPGFIDGHTHMDAQVMWDPLGSCSCYHGVTSVIMSNCGFTLAPCKPADREWYANSLSYVEDISTDAMAAGIDWTWETFPEYMAAVERRPKALNHAMYIGHSAIRMYVMGRRAVTDKATDEEIHRMARLVQEGLRAGAMGFSTSRTHTHMTPDGTPVASRVAAWEEIERIVASMAELDAGIFQAGPEILNRTVNEAFLARMKHFALTYRRPIMFGLISTKQGEDPPSWRAQAKVIETTNAAGGRMFGQGTTRPINAVFSLKSYLPFDVLPAWREVRIVAGVLAGVALLTALQAAGLFAVEAERLFVAALAGTGAFIALLRGPWPGRTAGTFLATLVLPLAAGALLISRTRNAWLGALVGLVTLAVMRVPRALWALAGIIAAILVLRPAPVMDRLTLTDASSKDRYYMWQAGIDMIREKPVFGQGPGMILAVYPDYRWPDAPNAMAPHLHDNALQIAAERGLPCLAWWIWWVAAAMGDAYRERRRGGLRAWVAAVSFAFLAAFMAAGLFEYNFGDSEIFMFALMLSALPYALRRQRGAALSTVAA